MFSLLLKERNFIFIFEIEEMRDQPRRPNGETGCCSCQNQVPETDKEVPGRGGGIIYTVETYIHTSHASQKVWRSNETSVNVPIPKGDRCIIVDAGSEGGFAKLIYDENSTSGDYYGEMNSRKFIGLLRGQLIPNLPPKSVVVIDASYHSVQEDKCPTQASRKANMQAWLTRNNAAWSNDMLKVELLG